MNGARRSDALRPARRHGFAPALAAGRSGSVQANRGRLERNGVDVTSQFYFGEMR